MSECDDASVTMRDNLDGPSDTGRHRHALPRMLRTGSHSEGCYGPIPCGDTDRLSITNMIALHNKHVNLHNKRRGPTSRPSPQPPALTAPAPPSAGAASVTATQPSPQQAPRVLPPGCVLPPVPRAAKASWRARA